MSQALLDAIRAEAKPALWANGVKLARANAAALEKIQGQNEHVFRVKPTGKPVALTVYLTPDDAWECSCDSAFDPCEHVVAAAITLAQGVTKTAAQTWTRLVYRFVKVEGGLTVTRELLHADGRVEPLPASLQSMMANGQTANLQVENGDLLADRVLERPWRGALTPERLEGLLGLLEHSKHVLLEGQPVAFTQDVMLPRVKVTDDGNEVVVTVHADPRVSEVVSPGVARCGEIVCRLGETALTGPWLHLLPSVRRYQATQLGELTSRVLPELAQRFPIDNYSKRLPRIDRTLEPRIELQLAQMDTGLSVLPIVVYGSPPNARVDGDKLVHLGGPLPLRKENAETKLVAHLRESLGLLPGRRTTFDGPELSRFVDKLQTWRGGLSGDARKVVGSGLKLKPKFDVQSVLDAFGVPRANVALEFEVEGGVKGTVSGEAVLRAWKEGLGLVPIEGGGWAPLPQTWLETHGARVQQLLAARGENGAVANHVLPLLADLSRELDFPAPAGLEKLKPLAEGFSALPRVALPEGMTATLRPYQQHGVDWLAFLKSAGLGGVLADDMGLGKTLQTICALEKGTLVVCPTSVLPNWKAELARFRPALSVNAYHGASRSLGDADVTLTTYAILRLDIEALATKQWRVVVLDEAQNIKNPDSQATRAAYRLKGDFKVAVTGTPLENRLDELWSLMHFTNPGLLGGRSEFRDGLGERIESGSQEATATLRKKIAPFVLRRLKRDVAPELPPRTEAVRFVTLEEKERAVYDAVFMATRKEVQSLFESGGSVMKALEALLRLRQAACHPALVPGQQAGGTSSKVTALVESLTTAASDGHRALVFSQWTSMLDLIEPELKKAGLTFSRLDGSTQNRGELVTQFQSADGPTVMLMSLKAGGVGLTLTAADHVFLVDPWWNPAAEAQAADRTHRIGQEKPVFVYRLVAQGTVEERILALQEKKRALFEAALDGDGAAGAAALTRDDLLALFD
ncbi:MAG: DEAD/DEAH box helicase [Archangium sp.]|nr:DEAD/DEAH box helicase [Archangium sp.]